MAITRIENGAPRAAFVAAIEAVIEKGLGAGAAGGLENYGQVRMALNQISADLSLPQIENGALLAEVRAAINEIIHALEGHNDG
ncbi:MAG TPA: hypothetical protein VNS12_14810 [Pelagibacterium sp.]|uniref:hypothetical protein n=1 Tax=Pelagibacterium sp. TaxID=1967288 RepID=UPI002D0E40A9|nr:hypothetical protein [Pelagibacterium sp.]HWJ89335.1 hypothetical protein [Pelagibacterium sp.]